MRTKGFFLAIPFVLLLSGCGRQLPDALSALTPQIRSLTVTDISDSGAMLIASVSHESQLAGYGFTVGEQGAGDSRNISASLEGNLFTVKLEGLKGGTAYSFRAFIDNGADLRIFSDPQQFTTLSPPPQEPPDEPENPEPPENPEDPGNPTPTEPEYVDLPDGPFRDWILWRYDADQDGRLSTQEALYIYEIELNTDEIRSLSGIEQFPELTKISAEGTRSGDTWFGQLAALNLSGNPKLQNLYVPHNRIAALDLSPTPLLVQCEVYMNALTDLDVSMLKRVVLMNVGHNELTRLDVRGLDALDELHCEEGPIRELLLDNKSLRYIDCHDTKVETLDLSKCPKMNILDCHDCPDLTTIYLAKGQVLGTLRRDPTAKIVYRDE